MRGLGGGGGHHPGGGGHHPGGGGRGGRGFRGGGAYFAPGGGYPYLIDDYGPTLLVVDDCPERVRNGCASQFPVNAPARAGCVQAGLSKCGVSGFGTFDLSLQNPNWAHVLMGVGAGYGLALLLCKK